MTESKPSISSTIPTTDRYPAQLCRFAKQTTSFLSITPYACLLSTIMSRNQSVISSNCCFALSVLGNRPPPTMFIVHVYLTKKSIIPLPNQEKSRRFTPTCCAAKLKGKKMLPEWFIPFRAIQQGTQFAISLAGTGNPCLILWLLTFRPFCFLRQQIRRRRSNF